MSKPKNKGQASPPPKKAKAKAEAKPSPAKTKAPAKAKAAAKSDAKAKAKPPEAPCPPDSPPPPKSKGRLLALEGVKGKELDRGSEKLAEMCGGVPCSRFDASNTFFELRLGKVKRYYPPPRTLMLLYAYDLLFRLRWEINPGIAEGSTVVAAPYVETAIGFGMAMGLPKEWLDELFSFAPKPEVCFRVKEDPKVKLKKKDHGHDGGLKSANGFVEFCSSLLSVNSPNWDTVALRAGVLEHFDGLEEMGALLKLGKKLPKGLGK
jgi:hypothetical protein